MAQTKKKTTNKTAKKAQTRKTGSKANTRTTKYKCISAKERVHVCLVAALSIIAGILLCADVAMVVVK